MDRLWAPWREGYVTGKRTKKCLFCQILKCPKREDRENYVIERTRLSFSLLNIYPYNNGHLMVIPRGHRKEIAQLSRAEVLDLFSLLNHSIKLLDKVLRPRGYNVGLNLGEVSGAGVPGHLHLHVVPRWQGDTNFMPVLADTKMISQSLDSLYEKLKSEALSLK